MPQLDIFTNSDAEVFVMDAALSRVARTVGSFSDNLSPGLYKIRVSRAGTFQEQLIELNKPEQYDMFISQFSAIAPIGPMLSEVWRIEGLGRDALGKLSGPGILVMAHQSVSQADQRRPFRGARIFPWRTTRNAVRLDGGSPITAIIGDELWAATAVAANPANGPFVLELPNGAQTSRQAVLVAKDWQTRIFLRANSTKQAPALAAARRRTAEDAVFDVSIQMARPTAEVVYSDHWETVEVARSALERGRAIFTSERLISELLHEEYDNPIAGLTGLHLFLDAKARSEAGDVTYDLAPSTKALARDEQSIADEVLVDLTRLLYPERAAAAEKQAGSSEDLRQLLLFPDPAWPESADLMALRVRAGRCGQQIVVPSPPMFRVSWDVLKANSSRDGPTWISRDLWSSTGAAGSTGVYLAWARGRHSVKRTLQAIRGQFAQRPMLAGSLRDIVEGPMTTGSTLPLAKEVVVNLQFRGRHLSVPGALAPVPLEFRPSAPASEIISSQLRTSTLPTDSTLESTVATKIDSATKHELAEGFDLPLSILQKSPRKAG